MTIEYPPPFHACALARVCRFVWFTTKGDRMYFETNRQVRDFCEQSHSGCKFVLSTMRHLTGRDWKGPENMVAMAVVDPRDVLTGGSLVVAFILGGIVPKGTSIPVGHNADDGCIPFDMDDVWSDANDEIPRKN